jgi:chromosome segregation ATPase
VKKYFIILTILFLVGCSPKEELDQAQDKLNQLQIQNDSLRTELNTSRKLLVTLGEVGSLIDSIDENRNALRVNIVEGTPYYDYKARLSEINDYVKRTEEKISELEKSFRDSNQESEAYQMMIAALKDELTISMDEIAAMEARVNTVLKENKDLYNTVKLQKVSLEDFQFQLDAKYEEVKLFELQIQELTRKLQITEATAYFTQAQALELAAKRTKLAPRKKKETYQQALALYKKALAVGNLEAKDRIRDLEKRYRNL